MINNVVLVGRMVREAELRYTPSNVAVATFTLAVNRNRKNQNGEREADFINCVMWRQQAENLTNWAKKGTLIGITGRIQTRNYENQQGQRVYVTEVVADNFQMLESKGSREANDNSLYGQNPYPEHDLRPGDLIKLDFTEELDEYRCHKSAPMNSTLMNVRKEQK